ncbi:MAG: dethiobiotin synthase [Candidatus Omnitrophota bacterium]
MPGHKIIRKGRVKGIFITGTDTGVGKTLITGYLAKYFRGLEYNCFTQKWIKTGSSSKDGAPYSFRLPASPHLAAEFEHRKIGLKKIINSFKDLGSKSDFVLVEGIGGALVPFNKRQLVIDIVKALNLPVLIVAQNKLGAINHTLLTIESLKSRGIDILGIVFNNLKGEKKFILKDNPGIIKAFAQVTIFGCLPWAKNKAKLYEKFIPIAGAIKKSLWTRGLKKT